MRKRRREEGRGEERENSYILVSDEVWLANIEAVSQSKKRGFSTNINLEVGQNISREPEGLAKSKHILFIFFLFFNKKMLY